MLKHNVFTAAGIIIDIIYDLWNYILYVRFLKLKTILRSRKYGAQKRTR